MANGINYSGSNKIVFTANNTEVLTIESGSGVNFLNPITASSLVISSSTTASLFTVLGKDENSTAKLVFPISSTASYFMETMSGSNTGDFRIAVSSAIPGGWNGIHEIMHVYGGGLSNGVRKTSFFSYNTESLYIDDTGSILIGTTGSDSWGYMFVKYNQTNVHGKIGFNTTTPNADVDINGNMILSGNMIVTGSLSVGFQAVAASGSVGKNVIQVSGSVLPLNHTSSDLGSSSLAWNQVWVKDGVIQNSDRDLKTDIETSDLGIDFINSLKPVSYKFINNSSDRTHYGLLAQDVENTLLNFNKTSQDFAGLIKNKNQYLVEKHTTEFITSSNYVSGTTEIIETYVPYLEMVDNLEKPLIYSLRYDEFISPMIKSIQELSKKLEKLENILSSSGN